MRSRFILAACMVMLLVTGMVASAACEMTCAPVSSSVTGSAGCCPQQMQHCAGTPSVMATHTCGHPQESPAAATDGYTLQWNAATSATAIAIPTDAVFSAVAHPVLPFASLTRSSFVIPLRI